VGEIIVFRLQRSSVSIQRRSVGCSVAQKDKALLRRVQLIQRVQRSSKGAAKLLGRI
jgi:hypothetical protein